MKRKTCCCIGLCPSDFPWDYYNTESKQYSEYIANISDTVRQLYENGCSLFICDGSPGASADFAAAVTELRKTHDVLLETVAPSTAVHSLDRSDTVIAILSKNKTDDTVYDAVYYALNKDKDVWMYFLN